MSQNGQLSHLLRPKLDQTQMHPKTPCTSAGMLFWNQEDEAYFTSGETVHECDFTLFTFPERTHRSLHCPPEVNNTTDDGDRHAVLPKVKPDFQVVRQPLEP